MHLTVEVGAHVWGTPAGKGSLKCVSRHVYGQHSNLQEDNAKTGPWRARIEAAGRRIAAETGITGIVGPVGVEVTVTVPLPASVKPETRLWPYTRSSHDVDKHARTILDGLGDALMYLDDAQVVELTIRKVYPHTPGQLDALTRPGATIRLYPIGV